MRASVYPSPRGVGGVLRELDPENPHPTLTTSAIAVSPAAQPLNSP